MAADQILPATALCAHCGSPAPQGSRFCCSGCAAAAHLISGLGLDRYYRSRTLDPSLPPPVPVAPMAMDLSPFISLESDGVLSLHLLVDGMHCAACVWLIETVLARQAGVVRARVNMTSKRLTLHWKDGVTTPENLISAVHALGYRLAPYDPDLIEAKSRAEERALLTYLAVAGFASANVMLMSVSIWFGEDMGDATRAFLHWLSALIVLPAAAYAGQPFFRGAIAALRGGRMSMDVPISLAVILTLGISVHETIIQARHAFFDSAITLLFFLLIGRYLDLRASSKARSAAESLLALQAGAATVLAEDGSVRTVLAQSLRCGDQMVVARGERIAADGVVTVGDSLLDTSPLTGETMPRPVHVGDEVQAGTVNLDGPLTVRVTAAGSEATLARIARLIDESLASRGRYNRLAERVVRVYSPGVHLLALGTFTFWVTAGSATVHDAILTAAAVLLVTCPCALALAVPTVQAVITARLFRRGILIKAPDALERLKDVDMVVFDKTGTLTHGDFRLISGGSEDVRRRAARLAAMSSHPLARALVQAAGPVLPLDGVREVAGAGLEAVQDGVSCRLGSRHWCEVTSHADAETAFTELWYREDGAEPVRFLFSDTLREDALAAVSAFQKAGLRTALFSGDREGPVQEVAHALGITDARAGCRPEDKHAALRALRAEGRRVLMIGDGINDAPALAEAHAAISFGRASTISQQSADLVLQSERLTDAVAAWETARQAERGMRINLGIALLYNLGAVPMAACGVITPLLAAILMSTSSLTVTLNALRLAKDGQRGAISA